MGFYDVWSIATGHGSFFSFSFSLFFFFSFFFLFLFLSFLFLSPLLPFFLSFSFPKQEEKTGQTIGTSFGSPELDNVELKDHLNQDVFLLLFFSFFFSFLSNLYLPSFFLPFLLFPFLSVSPLFFSQQNKHTTK